MAFVKKTWKDRISDYPNRRVIDDGIISKVVTVSRTEGSVTEEGDAFNASNMNDLEQRIYDAIQNGGGSGGATNLANLDDVNISNPTDGQVLKYNETSEMWENGEGGGGGGGGGHTIVDDDGTSLTQRTKLQFKGAYTEDNSTDSTTEVNIVRSMTKAEFDLLSDDEKVGIINVTDVPGGEDVYYSTDEQAVGTWIDGKTVYERTIVLRENSVNKYNISGAIGTGALYAVGLTGLDKIFITGVYAKRGSAGNTDYTDILSNSADVVIVFKHTDGSIFVKDTFDPTDIIVIIRYTKSST